MTKLVVAVGVAVALLAVPLLVNRHALPFAGASVPGPEPHHTNSTPLPSGLIRREANRLPVLVRYGHQPTEAGNTPHLRLRFSQRLRLYRSALS